MKTKIKYLYNKILISYYDFCTLYHKLKKTYYEHKIEIVTRDTEASDAE